MLSHAYSRPLKGSTPQISPVEEMLLDIARRHPDAVAGEFALLTQRGAGKQRFLGFIPREWIDASVQGQQLMPEVLDLKNPVNVFLTTSRFFKSWADSRLLRTLGAFYVDVDCYKLGLRAEDVWREIEETDLLSKNGVPAPTFVCFSGRGFHLVWVLQAEGSEAFPRNQFLFGKCQDRLCKIFQEHGSDENCKSAVTPLRIAGSTHHQGGPTVYVVEVGKETVSLLEMADALGVETTRTRPGRAAPRSKGRIAPKRPGSFKNDWARSLFGQLRQADLQAVSQDIGGFRKGVRNLALLAYVTAGRIAGKGEHDLMGEARELNRGFSPPLRERSVRKVVSSILRRRRQLDARGRYAIHKTRTLIDRLGVTEEQQRRLYLRTLIGGRERERRKRIQLQQSEMGREVLRVYEETPSATQEQLAGLVKCSQATISRVLQGAGIALKARRGRPRRSDQKSEAQSSHQSVSELFP